VNLTSSAVKSKASLPTSRLPDNEAFQAKINGPKINGKARENRGLAVFLWSDPVINPKHIYEQVFLRPNTGILDDHRKPVGQGHQSRPVQIIRCQHTALPVRQIAGGTSHVDHGI